MQDVVLNADILHTMLYNGYCELKRNASVVDNLNVFPVPDGDTGTNMTKTFEGGVRSVSSEVSDTGEYMRRFAQGNLLGARGNSGVILSQFMRGIAQYTGEKESLSMSEFASALLSGTEYAYAAVLKPVEGTMLTVMRETAEFAAEHCNDYSDLKSFFSALIRRMKVSLSHTPELLPVLKEAGVIDSGGAGLLCIFEGMEKALNGELLTDDSLETDTVSGAKSFAFDPDDNMEYGYCTEFILVLQKRRIDVDAFDIKDLTAFLESVGESIVAVRDGSLIKVHVHTFEPEKVLAYCHGFGEFLSLKIENMSVQHNETLIKTDSGKPKERKRCAVVAVASGKGIIDYLLEIGADAVIDGGQTNNPSADAFLREYAKLNCEHILVLPNNGNIILTAKQSATLYDAAKVHVLPTRSVAEGYSALSMMDMSCETIDEVIESMMFGVPNVSTGLVTNATRDSVNNGLVIHKGDFIGLDNDRIISAAKDMETAATEMLCGMDGIDDKQVVTVFYGREVSAEKAKRLCSAFGKRFPMIEFGAVSGGQEVYSLIMAVE